VGEIYTCSVCKRLAAARARPGGEEVWLLELENRTTLMPDHLQAWGEILGSEVDQLVVASESIGPLP
jgi:hypothetical protein